MKNLYKFFLALGVYSTVFSQIPEITRLPVQDISQSIKESASVWLTENEMLLFYVTENKDTIFVTKSANKGVNWSEPKMLQLVGLVQNQEELYLTSLKSLSGRIFLAWSVFDESIKLIYSDDFGENWSQPIDILGPGVFSAKRSELLNLTEWESGAICLSFFSPIISRSNYRLSYDGGINWEQDPIEFPKENNESIKELSIISLSNAILMAIFERGNTQSKGIYYKKSSDNGINWSESIVIADDNYYEKKPKANKLSNGNIVLSYLRNNVAEEVDYDDNDIFFKISEDQGDSWSAETRFTKYIGEDKLINLSSFQNKTFVSFATERFSVVKPNESSFQIALGMLGETVEKFTPPKVYATYTPPELIDFDENKFVYRATIIDDESLDKVSLVIEDSLYIIEMFDDGMHNDKNANDSIFGNVFPIVNARNLNAYYFSVNKIELPLKNDGTLAAINVQRQEKINIVATDDQQFDGIYDEDISLQGGSSGGIYEEGSFLFSAGFFLSGYCNGTLFANGAASSSLVQDYQPGKVGGNPLDLINSFYIISKSDPPFGSSWQSWKNAVVLGADFYDGDDDGIYNPVDKNFNGTWDNTEDMPPLIGDEIVWCIYNDGIPAIERRFDVDPLGIEIQQTLFASDDTELKDIIFIKYKVRNTGLISEELDSVYFSPWDDTDLGDFNDDLGGCDTSLQSVFTYNATEDQIYGNNPPAIFTSILQGPVTETKDLSDTAKIKNGSLLGEQILTGYKNLGLYSFTGYTKGSISQSDPSDVIHVWNYVHARDRNGDLLNPCDSAFGEVYGEVNCNDVNPMYWFSGDPVTRVGWLDNQARDDRKFSSIGPVSLQKDEPIEIILALVVGRGTDPFNSITVARENVRRAIEEYESNFASMTYSAPPATNPVNSYVLFQNYPNPFNPNTMIRYELPQDGQVTIDIFDILGQRVTTIVNEYKRADRYEVTFSSKGLASGVYIYQLRVNDFIQSKKMIILK
jgi:hypothetical protein